MAYGGPGYPNWLQAEYPGLEGINTADKGFNYLLNDPGFKQLAASQASDPAAQEYQAGSMGGLPKGAGAGLFGRLLAGQMGANVAGQASQDQGANAAQTGKVNANSAAANIMSGRQESDIALQEAEAKQAGQGLSAVTGGLNLLTNPKGLGGNIMGAFGGSGSPLSGITGLFSSLLGSGGGANLAGSGIDLASILGSSGAAAGVGGISDLTAAAGGAGAAGGLSDLFATLLESAPLLAA